MVSFLFKIQNGKNSDSEGGLVDLRKRSCDLLLVGNLIVYLAGTLHEQTWDKLNDHLAIEIVENCDPAHI